MGISSPKAKNKYPESRPNGEPPSWRRNGRVATCCDRIGRARSPSGPMWQGRPGLARWGEPSGRAAAPYCTTTTLKNRIAAFSAAVAPSTAFHSPSSVAAPFSTACISAPVQQFVFGPTPPSACHPQTQWTRCGSHSPGVSLPRFT